MRILVVDDEPNILEGETQLIRRCVPQAEVFAFSSSLEAAAWVERNPAEIAFLDLQMPDLHGITLAWRLKESCPRLNIIFVTAYPDYYQPAIQLRASGYLLKPLEEAAVLEELENLRYPVAASGLFVRCFGNFEVFFEGRPVRFRYLKTKELFAYLIDRRGSLVSRDELITILWGGETERNSYYKQVQRDLRDVLERAGSGDALMKQRGGLGLDPARIRCDYFDWMRGLPSGLNAFSGEYMRQYDWAEATLVNLMRGGGYSDYVLD